MAEADMAAFGAAIGVSVAFAVVLFVMRGKVHKNQTSDYTEEITQRA